jgi:branched-chain amino acid aminotransferase
MALPNYAFFNGRIVRYQDAKVGVLTHGLNYGTGVFGGIRAYWNQDLQQLFIFRPHDHFRRFLESTKLLRMEFAYSETDLTKALIELLRTENFKTDCYIRPLAFYSDEIIGVRLHDLTPALAMVALPFGKYVEKDEGSHVTFSSWRRVDDNMVPARGKITGSYINSAFAKTDAQRAGFDEAIMLNDDGHVCEGSAENIFVVRQGAVTTPPVTDNILEGITRQTVMTLLRDKLGLSVVERSIDRSEVYLAQEMFFTGTGAQITAVIRVDYRAIGTGQLGPVTKKLREVFFDAARGRDEKYKHWCVPVYESGLRL